MNLTDEISSESVPIKDRVWYQNIKIVAVVIRWTFLVALAIGSYWLYQRDVNAENLNTFGAITRRVENLENAAKIAEDTHDKQNDKLVTADKFEERTKAMAERLGRIEDTQKEILSRLPAK